MRKLLEKYFSTIRKFLPEKTAETSVGVDVGAGECKFVEIAPLAPEGFQLINWGILPINNGDIASAVKQLLGQLPAGKRSVFTSLSGRGTLIRYVDMPHMTLEELKNSFAYEADRYFPFSQEEIYTDCYIVDNDPKAKFMYVMAAAAKKEMVDKRLEVLKTAGVNVDFIGLNSVATANAIHSLGLQAKMQTSQKRGAMAVLDMGETVSSLTILMNGVPWFTRDIFIGGGDFTKRISNSLGVTPADAEKLKKKPDAQLQKILDACESSVMSIVQELRLSFDYFTTEKNIEITNLFLTGGASRMDGLASAFEKHFEIPVNIWNPVSSIALAEGINKDEIKSKGLGLGVALGLALYNYD